MSSLVSWDNPNLLKHFASLKNNVVFSDVTLVSDDQCFYPAHKAILSGASSFFNSVLHRFPYLQTSHPLLYLKGVNSTHLSYILDFIYDGKVEIPNDVVQQFVLTGEELKIEGLESEKLFQQSCKEETENQKILKAEEDEPFDESSMKAEQEIQNSFSEPELDFNTKETESKLHSEDTNILRNPALLNEDKPKKIYCYEKITLTDKSEIKPKVQELTEKLETGWWKCRFCGFKAKKKEQLAGHIESHFDGLTFDCTSCDKTFNTKTAARAHKYRYHRGL